ncbi:hypothetical protein CDAR_109101 [Caerostris darwini]|uniref:Uncharacterized protein n=1 Tax=Caerostris darwini TaxID=1538125 RepID=A0AAV4VE01_9ARAC|nr:hypothetical protein CDAR_109101 [Caerostris darwini]
MPAAGARGGQLNGQALETAPHPIPYPSIPDGHLPSGPIVVSGVEMVNSSFSVVEGINRRMDFLTLIMLYFVNLHSMGKEYILLLIMITAIDDKADNIVNNDSKP